MDSNIKEEIIKNGDVELQVLSGGHGETLVVLHGLHGLSYERQFLEHLSTTYEVIAPAHPGFDGSTRPDDMNTIDDVAYFYLDFLNKLESDKVHLLGLSLGGWIAAEMVTKNCTKVKSLVLADCMGIKVSGRETADITDPFILELEQLLEATWYDSETGKKFHPPLDELSEIEKITFFANRETATLLTWNPFMHNPKLRKRLHSVDVPSLVLWGEHDGIVSSDYGQALADSIPKAQFAIVPKAGHYPYLENQAFFAEKLERFITTISDQ